MGRIAGGDGEPRYVGRRRWGLRTPKSATGQVVFSPIHRNTTIAMDRFMFNTWLFPACSRYPRPVERNDTAAMNYEADYPLSAMELGTDLR
jgi:hypothetical protein